MSKPEVIADKIEEVIGQMFAASKSLDPKPSEYSIFYNPKKHASWFIVIFFADSNLLKKGITNGVCYQVYTYLQDEFNSADEISTIDRTIYFEPENRPFEKDDIDNLFERLIARYQAQMKVAGKEDIKECGSCGHDFNKHELACNLSEDDGTPIEGWIMCPEENCTCFQTWSADYRAE